MAKRNWLPTVLTLILAAALGFGVYFLMRFLILPLGMARAYWIVPIFGALGGMIGGILRGSNRFVLVSSEERGAVRLGVVGDIATGIGGSFAALFLFAGTLSFSPEKPDSYILLISVSLVAGVFAGRVLEVAGKKLIDRVSDVARNEAREEAHKEAKIAAARPKALAYATAARQEINLGGQMVKEGKEEEGKSRFIEGLALAEAAVAEDPSYGEGYVQKGRALHRLGKTKEALDAVEKGLEVQPSKAVIHYNRACYAAVLGRPDKMILTDLKKAFDLDPTLGDLAVVDSDLSTMTDLPEFQELVRR